VDFRDCKEMHATNLEDVTTCFAALQSLISISFRGEIDGYNILKAAQQLERSDSLI